MVHLAIMDPKLGFIPAILDRRKTIESRWYNTRRSPWGKVRRGDTVYFKNSGGPITACARISRVEEHALLGGDAAKILSQYGRGIGFSPDQIRVLLEAYRAKRYCILLFLENSCSTDRLIFDKHGFGAQAAWITMTEGEFKKRIAVYHPHPHVPLAG